MRDTVPLIMLANIRLQRTALRASAEPDHQAQVLRAALNTAHAIDDMDIPGFGLHPLKGPTRERWAISVNGNRRITFEFKDGNAYVLDYED